MSESIGGTPAIPLFRPSRILLAVNRYASHANLADYVETELREGGNLGLPITVAETVEGGMRANQEHFGALIEEGDLIVAVVGDGGFREVASAFLLEKVQKVASNLAITTVGGGDKCDMRWSLHGQSKAAPSDIIRNGLIRPTHPISWEMRADDETKSAKSVAFSYIGHGKTAVGAEVANSNMYRRMPKGVREADLVFDVLFDGTSFRCHWLSGVTAGETNVLGDLSVFAGPRMAGSFHARSRHYDEQQRLYVVKTGAGLPNTLIHMAGLTLGMPVGALTDKEIKFILYGQTSVHFDGEPMEVPFGSEITIDRYQAVVNLLYSPHMLPPDMRPPQ